MSPAANELNEALLAKGIRRLVFVRHANAAPPTAPLPGQETGMLGGVEAYATPHDWKRDDQKRPLTEKGEAQAEAARGWFLGPPLEVDEAKTAIVVSGARRATETAQLVAEGENSLSLLMAPSLHPAGIAPVLEGLFTSLGYGPVEKFADTPEHAEAVAGYADIVAGELASIVSGLEGKDTIAVFGHAVFLNAVALLIVGGVPGQAALDTTWAQLPSEEALQLLQLNLGEAEGILLERNEDGSGKYNHLHA